MFFSQLGATYSFVNSWTVDTILC